MNIMNVGGVHDNGAPRIQIGLEKNHGFIIEYNSDLSMVTIKDATTDAVLPILAPSTTPLTFRGQYSTFTGLTNAVTAGEITPANGDCYSIVNAGGTDGLGNEITAMCMVAYGTNKWFKIDG